MVIGRDFWKRLKEQIKSEQIQTFSTHAAYSESSSRTTLRTSKEPQISIAAP